MAREAAREAKAAAGSGGVMKGEVKGRRVRVKKEEVEEVVVPTLSPSAEQDGNAEGFDGEESDEHPVTPAIKRSGARASRKTSGRAAKTKKVRYAEHDEDHEMSEA